MHTLTNRVHWLMENWAPGGEGKSKVLQFAYFYGVNSHKQRVIPKH